MLMNKKTIPARAVWYIISVVVVIFSYLLFGRAGDLYDRLRFYRLGTDLVMLTCIVFLVKNYIGIGKREYTDEQLVGILLWVGILLRVGYMIYTPCNVRSHDLWEINENSYGHASYLLQVINGHLPKTNTVQFYQQPFFYLLGAALSQCMNFILRTKDAYFLVDAAKTVSCMASCISLVVSREIFRECGLTGRGLMRAMMLVTFLPVYFLSGGRVGPDALACLFMLLVFWYTLKWLKKKSWKNTILLALFYGFGMMTKVSCATLALFTALVFAGCLFQGFKDKTWKSLLAKYLVFGVISLPLGLWYSVRNYLLFGQSFTYVPVISKESSLYTGDYAVFQRIFAINVKNLFADPFAAVYDDYNLPVYALKSSLFGEFRFEKMKGIACVLLFFAALLAVCCMIAIIYQIGFAKGDRMGRLCLLAAVIFYASIVVFYLRLPYGCSMDFRYMLFLPVPIAVMLGKCPWFQKDVGRYADMVCIGFSCFSFFLFG